MNSQLKKADDLRPSGQRICGPAPRNRLVAGGSLDGPAAFAGGCSQSPCPSRR